MPRSFLKTLILSLTLLSTTSAWADYVDTLIAREYAPDGVVFEISSGETDLLSKVLPTVKANIEKLRDRFPELPIAIVTHGNEQFSLLTENLRTEAPTHGLIEKLVKSEGIDVHVCGTHAEWKNKAPEDFPDYVNVSASGPAQIKTYIELGYELIIVHK